MDAGEPRPLATAALGDHIDRLYRAAWGLCGSREDAEDLVQETYARVLARPRFLRGGDDLGYLLRALRNTYLTTLRTRSRRPSTVPIPDGLDPVDEHAGTAAHAAAETRELFAAVSALPEPYRDAVIAVDLVGLPYRDACKALGVRGGTLKSRLFRARRALLALIDPDTAEVRPPTGG